MAEQRADLPLDVTELIREGKIHLFQKGALKKNKTYYATLISTSQSGMARLELYENEKHSVSRRPSLMLVGSDVVKVEKLTLAAKEMRNAFLMSTRDHHYTFFVESTFERDSWTKALQDTLLGEVHHGASLCTETSNTSSLTNDIYESADDVFPQITDFMVTIDKKTQGKMSVEGKAKLIVERDSIAIISLSGKLIVRWNVKYIRTFKHTSDSFIVEAGRQSSTGEGNFYFLTDKGETIKNLVNRRIFQLKQKTIERNHHVSLKPATQKGHEPFPKPRSPVIATTYTEAQPLPWQGDIYDTLENVKPPPPPPSINTMSNRLPPPLVPPMEIISDNKITASYPGTQSLNNVQPPPVCQGSKTPPMKQRGTKVIPNPEIYSEPEIITDAWKSFGCEDMEIYSNVDIITPKQELESHYWQGETPMPRVNSQQEKDGGRDVAEDIYAQVDLSKKIKNRK